MRDIDLDGTIVAMTGASVGLGRAMALALASAGARVVLAAPEPDLLDKVASEIEAQSGPGRRSLYKPTSPFAPTASACWIKASAILADCMSS